MVPPCGKDREIPFCFSDNYFCPIGPRVEDSEQEKQAKQNNTTEIIAHPVTDGLAERAFLHHENHSCPVRKNTASNNLNDPSNFNNRCFNADKGDWQHTDNIDKSDPTPKVILESNNDELTKPLINLIDCKPEDKSPAEKVPEVIPNDNEGPTTKLTDEEVPPSKTDTMPENRQTLHPEVDITGTSLSSKSEQVWPNRMSFRLDALPSTAPFSELTFPKPIFCPENMPENTSKSSSNQPGNFILDSETPHNADVYDENDREVFPPPKTTVLPLNQLTVPKPIFCPENMPENAPKSSSSQPCHFIQNPESPERDADDKNDRYVSLQPTITLASAPRGFSPQAAEEESLPVHELPPHQDSSTISQNHSAISFTDREYMNTSKTVVTTQLYEEAVTSFNPHQEIAPSPNAEFLDITTTAPSCNAIQSYNGNANATISTTNTPARHFPFAKLQIGSTYYVVVKAAHENLVTITALKELRKTFEYVFPYYRSPRSTSNTQVHSTSNTPVQLVIFAVSKGKRGAKYKKICTLTISDLRNRAPTATRITEGALVHYESYTEYPQFVEVTQPPTRRNLGAVEADGIISDLASDPPGQQSVYIPPGDVRREAYRLSTFEGFPKTSSPINVPELARHGFLYTGFYDRVKCYSCGRTVEKWQRTDRPSDRGWHKQDCMLARGLGTDNVPIGGRFGPLLTNGQLGGSSSSASQPMDVGPSQTNQRFNNPVIRFPRDVPDLTRSGGTFQIQPGSSVVIGSSDPLPRQTPAPSRLPATSRPANPPSSAPPRGWRMANVISADHKRHLTNLYLNRELDRLASFGRWPTGRPNVSPVALARAAFFYLGDMDRTQCFSCGGVLRNWSYEDDAMDEHRTHFPNCRFVVGTERRNVPIPDRPETPQQLAERFPCRFPMNPHMRSEASRVDTFDRRWPINRTRAKPQEIAEAGFFFLGERDRVKCWYCNGGLQNWEYDDIPWVEHAKWFPNCQFMLQRQGQLFIYRYLSLSPHLPRPIIGRQDGSTIDPVVTPPVGQSARVQDIPPAEPRARVPTPPPTIVDPQEELRKRQERVDREMESSEMVKFVLLMGYSANAIRRVLLEKLDSGTPFDAQNIFEGTSPLLDAVMKMEEEIEKERQEEQATNIKFPSVSSNYSALSMGSMETAPSSGQASGVYQVSGFDQHDSDDEDIDLYGSLAEQPMNGVSVGAAGGATNAPVSAGFIGTVTNGPMSIGSETRSHLWDNVPDDPESMKEFIEQKKEERLCKICFTENADMVFIPCSHMVCCKTCTEAIRQCPVCRTKIEKAIKTYVK